MNNYGHLSVQQYNHCAFFASRTLHIYLPIIRSVLSSQDFSDSQFSLFRLQSNISKHTGHKLYKSLPRYDTMHNEMSKYEITL